NSRSSPTKSVLYQQGLSDYEIRTRTARLFGTALGEIVGGLSKQVTLRRVVFAGGDTSSFAARALEIEALKMIAPVVPGAPLCRVTSSKEALDGLEVNIKGGQVGPEEYFGMVLEGKAAI